MNFRFLIIAVFLVNLLSAQKFHFSKIAVSDTTILDKTISNIAAEVSKKYKSSKSSDSLEKLFKLEILAGNYNKSLSTVDNYREVFANRTNACTKLITFELYSLAKEIEKNDQVSFSTALNKAFDIKYRDLPEKYSFRIGELFEEDILSYKNKLQKSLQLQKNQDSITYSSALNLCLNYLNYKTFSSIQSQIARLLKSKDQGKYIVESHNLKIKKGVTVNVMVTRRKGDQQPLPVILTNNIYAGGYDYSTGKRAVAYGYVGVVVNTRGKRDSPDKIEPFEHESEDLYEIIDWTSKQPWCNGKVGMIGGSYLGFSQWASTKKMHPALKTIVPQASVGIGAMDFPMNNNVFMSYMLQWISYVTNNKFADESDFKNYNKWDSINQAWYKSGKSFRELGILNDKSNEIFQRWLDHPSYDKYWKKMVPYKKEFSKINIPILSTTGYYDSDQPGALYYLKEHYKYNKNAEHYLVIGPYDHGGAQGYASNILRGYELDKVAVISVIDLAFSWFDYILKGAKKPELIKDKINYQIMGANEWYHAPTIQQTHNSKLKLYFQNEKSSDKQSFILTKEKPENLGFAGQTVNFKDREEENVYFKTQKDRILANNALVYQTEVLDKDIIISGTFTSQLNILINKKDVDIKINLIQIEPDGTFFYLSDYLGRASYEKNKEKRNLLKPGKNEIIPITNSTFVSKKIPKGSKLIVVLGINKSPEYQINYGTGKDVSLETIADAKEPLEIKWYNDSYIEIPVKE
ncbi:CocE/NonD family hydrolase [Chryseobacterium sp. JUb7]|uniref:CocE/NonD family hydrolase n=1 Tax=Chryseobacterium sp. JUb7 TaxID=2940599 RepID=UPI002168C836|nr:CocE/NonD family hydrolase [Chryseobacterium sp. JUb7]MCS3530814.1 putative CocE/NonD family hydrolase [Chryseobacterium sp. JUb7]